MAGDLLSTVHDRVRGLLGRKAPEVVRSYDVFEDPDHRLELLYEWNPALPILAVLGQNPSKATAARPDHTITVLARRAHATGHGSLLMLNLHARVATKPSDMWREETDERIEAKNLAGILRLAAAAGKIVIAPGDDANPRHQRRAAEITGILAASGIPMFCLGKTRRGVPRHPSRTPYATAIEAWEGPWPLRGNRASAPRPPIDPNAADG
jgi:hypothetical protein